MQLLRSADGAAPSAVVECEWAVLGDDETLAEYPETAVAITARGTSKCVSRVRRPPWGMAALGR